MAEVGPSPRLVPCGTCGALTDALRAPRVRCIDAQLVFFCSFDHAESFDLRQFSSARERAGEAATALRRGAQPPTIRSRQDLHESEPGAESAQALNPASRSWTQAAEQRPGDVDQAEPEAVRASASDQPPTARSLPASPSPTSAYGAPEPPDARWPGSAPTSSQPPSQDALLIGIAAVSGLFSLVLSLAGSSAALSTARLVVICAGSGVLVAQAFLTRSDPRRLDRFSLLAGPLMTTLAAVIARLGGHAATGLSLTTAGVVIAASALITALVQRTTQPLDKARARLTEGLAVRARRLNGHLTEYCSADELRPGEEVLVEAGEVVPADGTVVAGEAQVSPWFGCARREPRGEGDPIVAGATVSDGALRVVTSWTGTDRAWQRLVTDRRRRADLESFTGRMGYVVAQRGALVAAGLVLLVGLASGGDTVVLLLSAAAAHAAFAHAGVAELAGARVARACLEALEQGIAFHAAKHLDEAGRVTVAALCARGTVLLGEPEVTGIEPLEKQSPEELLALAAGAESSVYHPVATSVLRAARARGVRPDATRNHTPVAGLGVTAVTATGKGLVVGSRALMLREKISVARAEQRITELESLGRSALLVAVDGHLTGMLALQDGLRAGARAAVQHLLDLGVEPVLLSGDSRETTEAIARNIDIEHVRPELPAAQRGDEVRQLSAGGAVVAVVGKSPVDDIALGAADVSIALRAAAATNADWSVGLVSDDVRDAARAIRIARKARDGARATLALTVAPAAVATLAVAFGLVGPALAPAAALLGTLAASLRGRED